MLRTAGIFVFFTAMLMSQAGRPAERFELVLKGGRIVDGTGSPWYVADVAISSGRIVKIGRIDGKDAERSIDVSGLVVAPGFVDMMGQTASPMLEDPKSALNSLTQGITTINAGEGASAAPLAPEADRSAGWHTMAEYFQLLDTKGLPMNVVQTVGHTQVRRIVLGEVDRQPDDEEMERMKDLVREAMEAGAIGVSTALIYPPAVYASTEEIAELAKVAGEYSGRYYTHIRNEGDQLLEAIDEALEIGRSAGVPVHIFHLKAAGRSNWPKIEQAIAKIKAARAAGQQVTADIYPYINNGLGIQSLIHPRHFAEGRGHLLERLDDPKLRAEIRDEMENQGGWENWYRHVGNDWSKVIVGRTGDERYAKLSGQSLAAMAESQNEDPWDTFFNLVRSGAFALPQTMTDANKIRLMREPFISFCTDVGPVGGSRVSSHPRGYGAFPRMLSRYVRDLGATTLERAVAQASAVATNDVMAYDRGRIAEGLAADIVVFDYEKLADRATFAEPHRLSEGMKYVVVNGQIVLEDGKLTGKRSGRVLRGPGYDRDTAPSAVSTGKADARTASFDRMVCEFMEKHHVPGLALAVTDRGRLVYARGHGYADVATKEKVTPTSLFRIASISKPITAVAILQLVERNRLSLDDKVFDILKHEPHLEKDAKRDERLQAITIRHLLQHRGGWDRGKSFDAMFQSVRFAEALGTQPPAGTDEVIRFMLGQPLDFEPGERYAYSNYGYCLLGRVIEAVTNEDYVKTQVLAPLGIHTMRVGKTRLDGRSESEVRYYDPRKGPSVFAADLNELVPQPYGAWHLEAMDAHGGWLASAVDLARFARAFDDPTKCKILSPDSIQEMFVRPPGLAGHDEDGKPKPVYYSCGWLNRVEGDGKLNRWHTGSLPGTATLLVRRHDGRNWVVLMNARMSPQTSHLGGAIDSLVHQAADEVTAWPEYDLSEEFQ
ncbi:MAG: serine hydrolase [Planctomycetes bacterium]|nr:serine hydrolase [Planctomycetota bacterium]MBL7038876.1 serine hydrolase [Pirellulaceae bacterium]